VVTDNGGTGGGNVNSVTNTFAVSVGAVNHPPTLDPPDPVAINEDSVQQTVTLAGITAGSPSETSQILTVTAFSSDTTLVPNPTVSYTSPNTTGTLQFTPAANSNGVATITVIVSDDGGTANGGVNSVTNSFTITVNTVNDPPTLDALGNLTLDEDAGQQTVNLAGISAGPPNETGQGLTVTATSSNPGLIPDPTVSYTSPNPTGNLQFTSASGSNGVAVISVVVIDSGSPVNGGVNSITNTFTVTVTAVNDPPTLDALGNLTLDEDAGQQTVNLTGITAGPSNETGQSLSVTATSSNPGLIPNPTVSYTSPDATGNLQFTPTPGSNGEATISVVVTDNGGSANGGVNSVTNTFTVTVNAVTTIWNPDGNLTNTVTDANGPAGTGFEQLNLTGDLDIQATPPNPFTIHLVSLDGTSPGPAANFDYTNTYTWTIVTTTRGVTGFDESKFVIDDSQFANDLGGGVFSVTLSGDSNSVNVVFNPNHAPVANAASYARAWGTWLRIPIAGLIADFTSDADGDARALVRTGVSTNGALVSTDDTYVLFAPTNNSAESFYFVVRDGRNYRLGDTIQMATNWLTVTVTNAVGNAQTISTSDGGGVTVRFAGVPGYAYDVERSPDLVAWNVVLTTNAPPGGIWSYVDADPPRPQAYYRIKQH
jgi:hypothetical protein